MALPKITVPTYTLTLPCSGKKVNYRGFLAKEEKILLLAVQSQEEAQMVNALKQIISLCTNYEVDPEILPMYSIEYIYLQIVTKSIGEELQLSVKCGACDVEIDYTMNLAEINVPKPAKNANVIKFGNIGIKLKYPTLDTLTDIDIINEVNEIQEPTAIFDSISKLTECIFDDDGMYYMKDQTKEETYEWFDMLSSKQLATIIDFFANIPTVEDTIEFKCVCGHQNVYRMRGISELFLS